MMPSALTSTAAAVGRAKTPQLRGYQRDVRDQVGAAWASGIDNVLAVLPTGAGKCLAKGTPVLMYDGSVVPVESVRPGDSLMGPDSTPRRVLSLARGREQMYRVTPVKGAPYTVNESHILSLKRTPERVGDPRGGEVVNVSVEGYLRKSETWKHLHKGWRTGVDFSPAEASPHPVPPYILGAWLGDGTEKRGVCLTNCDPEVLAAWYGWAADLALSVRVEHQAHTDCSMHYLTSHWRAGGNPALNALRDAGVHGKRHIPLSYRTASRDDRLALLAGILDTDGYLSRSGFDLISKSEELAADVAFLARSLGLACYVAPCRKRCTNTDVWGDYFRLSISGDLSVVPCRVPRRKAAPRMQKKSVLVTGIRVEPVGEGEYFGFEIDGDRLFMLGDFTVTHNTVLLAEIVHNHVGASCVIAHRQELVSQISVALARAGVRHRIIAPRPIVKAIMSAHLEEVGHCWIDPTAQVAVAGVDTLKNRVDAERRFLAQVTLWVQDEAHHVLKGNKWGKVVKLFPSSCSRTPRGSGSRPRRCARMARGWA